MATKPKYINFLTPKGTAIYPKLNVPDTKYKPTGEYSTKLKLSGEEAQPLIDQYEAEAARFFEEVRAELNATTGPKAGKAKARAKTLKLAADKPFKPEYDEEGNETGNYIINFKMPARIVREGKEDIVLKFDVFDAAGKKLAKVPDVWGGSILRVSGQMRPFDSPTVGVGLSMRLQAVQIIELRQGGQRDAAGYGFGAEEGGFSAQEDSSPFAGGDDNSGGDAPADNNPDF